MNGKRILTLARRVIRQIANDRRTMALVILAPMLMLTLGAILFRAEAADVPIGIVNEDKAVPLPDGRAIQLGQGIADALAANEGVTLVALAADDVESALRDGTAQGVVVLPADFSADFIRDAAHQAVIDLRLEGSNPSRNRLIAAQVAQAAVGALAELGMGGLGAAGEGGELPITVETTYLYAGESLDTLDYIAPPYIAFLSFFFVFLLTCVAFLRERSQGTMERLLATPATRLEIILGYMGGLGLFAMVQVLIIVAFTIWVLKVHFAGSVTLMLVIVGLLALVGVSMGILASTFARNEFQVLQFIPIVIIPQALLSGMVWPIEDMPAYLRPLAYIMPLTYANRALRDVMLKGQGLTDIWLDLLILLIMVFATIGLGALTVRREVA
jgi:ABC-2 type transport system permease protein